MSLINHILPPPPNLQSKPTNYKCKHCCPSSSRTGRETCLYGRTGAHHVLAQLEPEPAFPVVQSGIAIVMFRSRHSFGLSCTLSKCVQIVSELF